MGVPDPIDMMDHIDCSAIYIDPRVQSERWVHQGAPAGSLISPDEPESLRSDIEVLLDVCRRSMPRIFAPEFDSLLTDSRKQCTFVKLARRSFRNSQK